MKNTQKIFSYWWVRFLVIISILISSYFLIKNIIILSLIILISSLLIESLRVDSSYKTLGFDFNKKVFYYISIAFLLNSFIFVSLTLLNQTLNGIPLFSVDDWISFYYLLDISVLIFFSAFFEEIVFRGIIYQSLIQGFGKYISTLVLSICFVVAHIAYNNNSMIFFL